MEDNVNSKKSKDAPSDLQYVVSNVYPEFTVIEMLQKFNAEVIAANSVHGFSPVFSAALNNASKELTELLLGEGVNKQNSNDFRCMSLLYAFRNQSLPPDYATIELLLKYVGDIRAGDFTNGPNTVLQYVIKHPKLNYELLDLVLKYKPNVNAINFMDGLSILQYTVKNPNSNPKIIELLLESGADVHAKNRKDGDCTALLYAVRKSTLVYEEIELLLRFQSDVNAVHLKSRDELSVLQYAVSHPNVSYKIIELLLKYNATDYFNSTVHYAIRNTNVDPKVVELICTWTKYKINFDDIIDSGTNIEAIKVLMRRESDHFHTLKDCLDYWGLFKKCHNVGFEILKWLVLQHFKKNPENIKELYTVKSVLGARYMKLISGYKFRDVLYDYLNKCILEIISLKLDGLIVLLFPEMGTKELSSIGARIVANRLLNICSKETPSIYLDVIESNIKSRDLLDFLLEFQISTRLTLDGSEKTLSLGHLPTQLIVEKLPLRDMLNLVQAFYGFFKNQSTLEKLKVKSCLPRVKLARACKKQRLN